MFDRFGRLIDGLRISLTRSCNLSCFFCHREGCVDGNREMSAKEIVTIVKVAEELGIREVKLTGGEPTLRVDLLEIVAQITDCEISMTTNATLLEPIAERLAEAGLKRVNIDLPTLKPERYSYITGANLLEKVIRGIHAAKNSGLSPIKINMVVLKNLNEDEIEKMIDFCSKNELTLQLIELIPFKSELLTYWTDLKPIELWLEKIASRIETRSIHFRKRYLLDGCTVEIVRPMHNSQFCLHCRRLRLTPDGYLKPCLMVNDNLVDVLSPLREGKIECVRECFLKAVESKVPFFK